jgi:hypothetical protein
MQIQSMNSISILNLAFTPQSFGWRFTVSQRTVNLHVTAQPPTLLPPRVLLAISLHLDLEYQRSEDKRLLGIENGCPTPETGEQRCPPPDLVTQFGLEPPDERERLKTTSGESKRSRKNTTVNVC